MCTGRRFIVALLLSVIAGVGAGMSSAAPAATLTVSKTGSGSGTVTSNVGGIACGATCSDTYTNGTSITLTAAPAAGSQFTGWLGPCTGPGTCQFTFNDTTTAVATFALSTVGAPRLDIDGTATCDAMTDGLLIIRYLSGLSGAALINGAVGQGASRSTDTLIGGYLSDIKPVLDIDGDGRADPVTDGLLIMRYLFGLRGDSLVANATEPGAIRTSVAAIEAQFQNLCPPTFTVNSPFDVVAALPLNNGVCETGTGNGVCTLRAAIMKANHFPGGGVIINVPANVLPYKLTIGPAGTDDETTGDLNITASMTILGAGAANTIIDGNATDRLFRMETAGVAVTISGVTVRNGLSPSLGGGFYVYAGTLSLSNSIVTGNAAFHGGGISSSGYAVLTLNNVTVSGNHATYQGGGLYTEGSSSLTFSDGVMSNNTAGTFGGGISTIVPVAINRSVIAGNYAGVDNVNGGGGGLHIESLMSMIANSTITANHTTVNGGGIDMYGTALTVQNSTISANSAHGNGGGINQAGTPGGIHLFHVTVAGNTADSDAIGAGTGGGIYRYAGSAANEVWNSIVAENYVASLPNDCAGIATTSQDYNYFQTQSGCTLNGTTTHNLPFGGDPLLDGLQFNGGPTPTRALLAGSPALDQIPAVSCRDAFGAAPNPDQRGVTRPVGTQCDIGAYEGSEPASLIGRNLLRNGDAENGAGSTSGATVGIPNWTTVSGVPTVVPYNVGGGFPSVLTDVVPVNHGYNFFAGGTAQFSAARQTIAVASLGAAIDAGQVNFSVAGDFGGYFTQDDSAALTVRFRNGIGNLIGTVAIGNVTAADRANATGFQHRSASNAVPVGTRTIDVDLTMQRVIASGYNDGYADNLSLVLTGP